MKYFIQWLIIYSLILLGSFYIWWEGLITQINTADITKLTFAIYAIFIYHSVKLGILLYFAEKRDMFEDYYLSVYEKSKIMSNWLIRIGLIGTVIGFIYMLNSTFSEIDVANTALMQNALASMATGMGTALYTTAAGMICSFILNIELLIFKNYMDD